MFGYSGTTLLILIGMIVTGAARIVSVKLFFQLEFQSPLMVTLLYLAGQSLSLVVYWISQKRERMFLSKRSGFEKVAAGEEDDDAEGTIMSADESIQSARDGIPNKHHNNNFTIDDDDNSDIELTNLPVWEHQQESSQAKDERDLALTASCPIHSILVSDHASSSADDTITLLCGSDYDNDEPDVDATSTPASTCRPQQLEQDEVPRRRGSFTGLTEESKKAVSWVHAIPWYLKPTIPAFFNLCNSTMRLASLVYLAASFAEIWIAGLELTLSVVAARLVRRRRVAASRWAGIAVIVTALMFVELADLIVTANDDNDNDNDNGDDTTMDSENATHRMNNQLLGLLLIMGECITSVMQDLAEEIFMDESDFSPTLLLGMEGLQGLIIGLILYVPVARLVGEDPWQTFETLTSSSVYMGYALNLTLLFTLTGIMNIMATAVTSSMTRNVWKNLRTLLVWVFGLVIFAASGNDDVGEPWRIPESLIVPAGSIVVFAGIYLYYKDKQ
jgi:hypothetical protein